MPRVVTAASSTSTSAATTAATAAYETRYLDTLSRCYLPLQLQNPQDKQADGVAVSPRHQAEVTVVGTCGVVVLAECDLYTVLSGVFECHAALLPVSGT